MIVFQVLFPGLWMGNVSSEAYKVSEHAWKGWMRMMWS